MHKSCAGYAKSVAQVSIPVSIPAVSPTSKSAGLANSDAQPVWKPAIRQTWKSALLVSAFASVSQVAADRLDRTNLMIHARADGAIESVKSTNDWQRRRAIILRNMQEIMGPLPAQEKRVPLDFRIIEETNCGDYIRRLINFTAEPNGRVPAYVLIPKKALTGPEKCPAVLSLHSTQNDGFKATAGVASRPGNEHGVELARRGYVVLTPPYPLLADYHPDPKALRYESGTMKAIWDNMRALDVLESLPFVKTNGFGAIGHSLGGHNAIYTAVFDDRIKVIVSSCGFDSYVDYMDGKIQGWTSARYMPKLLDYRERLTEVPVDFYEMIGALAPRAFFVNAPQGDSNFKWGSVAGIVKAARPVYGLFGEESRLRVEHPDCGHEFPKELRELAYEILDRHLK